MRARSNLNFSASSIACAALAIGLATSSCGFLPKKVTKEECEKWGDQFATMVKDAFAKEMKKCAGKVADETGDKADKKKAEKAGNAAFDKEIDGLKDTIVKGCSDQEGKSYISKDADCYMKAKELKDWKTCDFKTPFFTDFSDLAEKFGKTMQGKCDEGIEKGKAKGGGKKPKASDDD
jgi:hypothetical protein